MLHRLRFRQLQGTMFLSIASVPPIDIDSSPTDHSIHVDVSKSERSTCLIETDRVLLLLYPALNRPSDSEH